MRTTYGSSDRLRHAAAGRSTRDANVIPLEQAKQRYPQRLSRVVRQPDGPNIVSLATRRSVTPSDQGAAPGAGRRRRRSTTVRQWLPTALFVGAVIVLIALLIGVRMILSSSSSHAAATSPSPASSNVPAVTAAAPPPQNVVPVVEPTAQKAIKFTATPVQPSYTVAAGDNLWTIAEKNQTTAAAVQSINNLPDKATLSVGQRLVMP